MEHDKYPQLVYDIHKKPWKIFIFRCFRKLWKTTISLVMSVHLSALMEQIVSHFTDFHEIWYLSIFKKSVQKIQVSLKSDMSNEYFT